MKMHRLTIAVLATILALFTACNQNNGKTAMAKTKEQTITYGVGRFVISIPVSMQYRGGTYSLRGRNIEEVVWPDKDADKAAEHAWEKRIEEIKSLPSPEGVDSALIEVKEIEDNRKWCKAALYFNEPIDPDYGALDVLLNSGMTGVWIKAKDKKITAKSIVYEIATEIAKAYRPPTQRLGKAAVLMNLDAFYLEHGAIDLPFEYKESVDIGFKGHKLDDKLELSIETYVVQEIQQTGLIDRLSAAIAAKFSPGVKVEKIRTKKRKVAGLEGEEVIIRGTEEGKTALNFQWNYPGRENAGHYPEIIIIMDSQDARLEEKIALWDAILDSMHPAGR